MMKKYKCRLQIIISFLSRNEAHLNGLSIYRIWEEKMV